MDAMATTSRQKCAKWHEPTILRACRKKRLPNAGNLPILGIGSFLHRPVVSRVGFVYTNMEGKTRFHCKINLRLGASTDSIYSLSYKMLPQSLGPKGDIEDASNPATNQTQKQTLATAMKTQFKEFLCPNSPRGLAQRNPAAQPQSAGITSYKAMGASTRDSLAMVADPRGKAALWRRGDSSRRCDLSGQRHSHRRHPRRHLAYHLPDGNDRRGRQPLDGGQRGDPGRPAAEELAHGHDPPSALNFFAPPGYDATFGENSGVTKAGLRTFLSYKVVRMDKEELDGKPFTWVGVMVYNHAKDENYSPVPCGSKAITLSWPGRSLVLSRSMESGFRWAKFPN